MAQQHLITSGTLPANATVGDVYVKTGASAGVYACLATDSWTQVSGESGTYTPSLFNVANVPTFTAFLCQYIRVGNVVTVSGRVDVDPTLAATSTQLGMSLPVASNFANNFECAGTAFASGVAAQGAAILGDTTNDRAQMQWISGDVSNQPMFFTFTYLVI